MTSVSNLAAQGVTAEHVINSLAEMLNGLKHLKKFLKVDGSYLDYDFTGATAEDLAAIAPVLSEIKTDYYTEGRGKKARQVKKVSLKWVDRRSVIELLGRWSQLGLWKDSITLDILFNEMTMTEMQAYAERGILPERLKERFRRAMTAA